MRTLRDLREQRGLTLRQLERHTGIFSGRLSKLERGAESPTVAELLRLGEFYGIGPEHWRLVPAVDS